MTRIKRTAAILPLLMLVLPQTAAAKTTLDSKEEAQVARAAPRDRDDVRYCLIKKKKGAKTGTIAGAAGGAGVGLIAGGNFGETALAAGAGALAGRAIGKGTSTDKTCDRVLAANK
jgi:outer membrane lipoprotein SlyB